MRCESARATFFAGVKRSSPYRIMLCEQSSITTVAPTTGTRSGAPAGRGSRRRSGPYSPFARQRRAAGVPLTSGGSWVSRTRTASTRPEAFDAGWREFARSCADRTDLPSEPSRSRSVFSRGSPSPFSGQLKLIGRARRAPARAAAARVVEGLALGRLQVALAHQPLDDLLQELVARLGVAHEPLRSSSESSPRRMSASRIASCSDCRSSSSPVALLVAEPALQQEVGQLDTRSPRSRSSQSSPKYGGSGWPWPLIHLLLHARSAPGARGRVRLCGARAPRTRGRRCGRSSSARRAPRARTRRRGRAPAPARTRRPGLQVLEQPGTRRSSASHSSADASSRSFSWPPPSKNATAGRKSTAPR
jgi:hypothetical protein